MFQNGKIDVSESQLGVQKYIVKLIKTAHVTAIA